jgi:dihydroorotase/N-acyl-D-amino-acid deacylase
MNKTHGGWFALPSSPRPRGRVTPAADYDLIVRGGRVVDGSGARGSSRTWACGRKTAAVGKLEGARQTRHRRDGLYVVLGFIDLLGRSEYTCSSIRGGLEITQGITTEVTGEGASIASPNTPCSPRARRLRAVCTPDFTTLDGYFKTFERRGSAINLATFVGAGSVRDFVIGKADRRATPEELKKMCDVVDQAMRDGAIGVSSSLQYVPDMYNSTDELIAMAKVAARYGGAYFTHQRSEANAIDSSLDEVFRISKEAGIRAQIWHLKTAYKRNWGRMPAVLARIAAARARHRRRRQSVPWTAGPTGSTPACRRGSARAAATRS